MWHKEQVWGYTFGTAAEKSLIMVAVGNFLLELRSCFEPDEEDRDRLEEVSLSVSGEIRGFGPSRL